MNKSYINTRTREHEKQWNDLRMSSLLKVEKYANNKLNLIFLFLTLSFIKNLDQIGKACKNVSWQSNQH